MAWSAPAAGELTAKIRFERRPPGGDGYGNVSGAWAPLCGPFSAALRPLQGREQILAGRLDGVQPYEIVLGSNSATRAIATSDAAVDVRTGLRFDITAAVDPDQRRTWVQLITKQGDAETG